MAARHLAGRPVVFFGRIIELDPAVKDELRDQLEDTPLQHLFDQDDDDDA